VPARCVTRRAGLALAAAVALASLEPGTARARNEGDAVAGIDAALTGGAVVANVDTGAALWFNPAGVVRLDDRSIGLTGAIYSVAVIRAPGTLRLSTGEQTDENQLSIGALPRAITFVGAPSEDLKVGFGLFYSRNDSVYLQDQVASDGAVPAVTASAASRGSLAVLHMSTAVGYRVRPGLLIGFGLDLVYASATFDQQVAVQYDGGASGVSSDSINDSVAGGGLQLRGGVQWQPHERIRLGASIAMPTYLVFLDESTVQTRTEAPPGGPAAQDTAVSSSFHGTWSGIEPGSVRGGIAYLDRWGFLELDVVGWLPLRSTHLGIDDRGVANVRIGGVFDVRERLQLGFGVFTDPSPRRHVTQLLDDQIDNYGFTVGFTFQNRREPAPGEALDDGFYLALGIAIRYSHGTGPFGGLLVPATYDPNGPTVEAVSAKLDEVGGNLAIKALF